jgi:hypothetical protein
MNRKERFLKNLRKAAEQGDAEAQFELDSLLDKFFSEAA